MLTLDNAASQIFSQPQAIELAAILNSDTEDDWTYVVENNPNPDGLKTALIRIYDENDELVATM